jgi:hypothetical protein
MNPTLEKGIIRRCAQISADGNAGSAHALLVEARERWAKPSAWQWERERKRESALQRIEHPGALSFTLSLSLLDGLRPPRAFANLRKSA